VGQEKLRKHPSSVKWNIKRKRKNIRAADAKEVGVGNPAEETYCYPNNEILCSLRILSTPSQLMLTILMHSFLRCSLGPAPSGRTHLFVENGLNGGNPSRGSAGVLDCEGPAPSRCQETIAFNVASVSGGETPPTLAAGTAALHLNACALPAPCSAIAKAHAPAYDLFVSRPQIRRGMHG